MKQRVFAPNELLHDEIVSKKSYTSFRNAKLNNSKLNNAFIIGADFSNAKLNHAKLNEVFVYSSKFIDAKLKHAQGEKPHFELVDFSKANLKHAELKGLTVIGFKGRDINKVFKKKQFKSSFRGAKMQDVVLDKSMIMGVDFSDANLKNATFNGEETNEERSRLIGVIFNGEAKLNNSEFNNAILTCVDFSDAKLEGAKFNKIKADGQIKFHNADLTESEFNGARLLDVDFSDANLEGAELKEIYGIFLKFSKVTNVGKELGTNLRNTVFNGSEIENSNFTWSNLEETYLDNVTFKNVDFSKAVFKRNKFTGTKFYDSTLEESDLSDLHFNQVIINNTSFLRAKINNVSFFESTLVKIDMKEIIASELIFDSMKLMWNLNFSHARIKYFCIESSDILGYFLNFTDALLEEAFFLGTAYRHKKRLANGWKTVITGGKLFFPSFDNSRLSGVYIANTAIFGENGLNHSLPYGGVCLNRCFFLGWDKPNTLKINESYSDYYFTKDDDFKKLLSGGRLSSELKSLHKIFVQIMLSQKNIKVNEDIPKSFEHKWPHHPGMAERLLERFLGKVVDAIPI